MASLLPSTGGVPNVTFIVPCYNYGRYVSECLHSILAQQVQDFEIIVINDASQDDTGHVVRSFTDPSIRYIEHAENRGLVACLEEGVANATGEFVARIDADDVYEPWFLSETLPIFAQYPEVALVYGDARAIGEDGTPVANEWIDRIIPSAHGGDFKGNEFLKQLRSYTIPAPATIARRDACRSALPFPEWFEAPAISDWFWNGRIMRHHESYHRAKVLARYRVHGRSMSDHRPNAKALERTVRGALDEFLPDRRPRRLYGETTLQAAQRYFSQGNNREARRCYLEAIAWHPQLALRPAVLRQLIATTIPRETYEFMKRTLTVHGPERNRAV